MKILITSDNHLGYKELDIQRSNDTFVTLKEILNLATYYKCDLILQVGDLFHDNRPSRYCLNETIKILSSNNIPVVAIHGNHDDPSGINYISSMDILQSAGIITYIGKFCDGGVKKKIDCGDSEGGVDESEGDEGDGAEVEVEDDGEDMNMGECIDEDMNMGGCIDEDMNMRECSEDIHSRNNNITNKINNTNQKNKNLTDINKLITVNENFNNLNKCYLDNTKLDKNNINNISTDNINHINTNNITTNHINIHNTNTNTNINTNKNTNINIINNKYIITPLKYNNNIYIYGIGYTKDTTLNTLLKSKTLIFKDLTYNNTNILLIHQNKVHRTTSFNSNLIPKEFNIVFWGHEHDPQIFRGRVDIVQTGSTVRTSLSESENNNKYVYIYECGDKRRKDLRDRLDENVYERLDLGENDLDERLDLGESVATNDLDNIVKENDLDERLDLGESVAVDGLDNIVNESEDEDVDGGLYDKSLDTDSGLIDNLTVVEKNEIDNNNINRTFDKTDYLYKIKLNSVRPFIYKQGSYDTEKELIEDINKMLLSNGSVEGVDYEDGGVGYMMRECGYGRGEGVDHGDEMEDDNIKKERNLPKDDFNKRNINESTYHDFNTKKVKLNTNLNNVNRYNKDIQYTNGLNSVHSTNSTNLNANFKSKSSTNLNAIFKSTSSTNLNANLYSNNNPYPTNSTNLNTNIHFTNNSYTNKPYTELKIKNLHNPFKYPPLLPLLRLRINTSLTLNKTTLTNKFKSKVANPHDIIKFKSSKKPTKPTKPNIQDKSSFTIEEIIKTYLKTTPLECIPEKDFIEWVNDKIKFYDVCINNMKYIQSKIVFQDCLVDDIENEIRKCKEVFKEECIDEGSIEEGELNRCIEEGELNRCIEEGELDRCTKDYELDRCTKDYELDKCIENYELDRCIESVDYLVDVESNEKRFIDGEKEYMKDNENKCSMDDKNELNESIKNEFMKDTNNHLTNKNYNSKNDNSNKDYNKNDNSNKEHTKNVNINTTSGMNVNINKLNRTLDNINESNRTMDNTNKSNLYKNKDSRTLRKILNENKVLLNKEEDTTSDCSKISSNVFSSNLLSNISSNVSFNDSSTLKKDLTEININENIELDLIDINKNKINVIDNNINSVDSTLNKEINNNNEKLLNIDNKKTQTNDNSTLPLQIDTDSSVINKNTFNDNRKLFTEDSSSTDLLIDF